LTVEIRKKMSSNPVTVHYDNKKKALASIQKRQEFIKKQVEENSKIPQNTSQEPYPKGFRLSNV